MDELLWIFLVTKLFNFHQLSYLISTLLLRQARVSTVTMTTKNVKKLIS